MSIEADRTNTASLTKTRRLDSTAIHLRVVMMVVAAGCAPPELTGDPQQAEPVGIVPQAATSTPTCVTIQRGLTGSAVDTYVSSGDGGANLNRNFGASPFWISSSTSEGLLQFDLSAVPVGATITSASMVLNVARTSSSSQLLVRAHRITEAWDELSVTYNTFQQAFSPAIEASFLPVVGATTVDVQNLVQEWVSEQYPNDGLLLEEDAPSSTAYFSSENSPVGVHPSLTVCYTVAM